MYQNGIKNAVAPCGTALRFEQLCILKSLVSNCILCFDNDEAGNKAFEKAEVLCKKLGMGYSRVILDDSKDPDDYFKKHTKEEFEGMLK
jgi:DNA primase